MLKQLRHRIALGIAAVAMSACTAALFFCQSPHFDEAYWECEEQEAEWKLTVNYTIDGVYGEHEMDAYYCRRPVQSQVWDSWFRPNQVPLIEPLFSRGGWSSYACSLDGTGYSQHGCADPLKTPEGVDVKVEFSREGSASDVVIKETFPVPFQKAVDGKLGKVAYQATWQRLTPTDSSARE